MVMAMMGKIYNFVHGLKAAMLMVVVQLAFAGLTVFLKLAAYDGMSVSVIVAYRFIFATAFMVPVALIMERKSKPKLTWTVLFQAFLCGFFGGPLVQNLYLESMVLTSATFVSAMTNLVPAITFILAVSFGLEKLGLTTMAGKAKVLGTLIGIGGAMLLTFYKGAEIAIWSTHVDLLKRDASRVTFPNEESSNPVLGSLMAVGSSISISLWLIIQAKMSERYPYPYSSTALMSLMASIQSIVFAFCMEKDWSQWKLGWNIRLLTVTYTGIVVSGLMVTLISWCVRMRGPLFVSVFNPLNLVFVVIMASLLLDEKLHLGSILGAVLIICGLYMVLWGKRKEMKKTTDQLVRKCKEMKKITQLVPSISSPESDTIEVVITSSTKNINNINSNTSDKMDIDLSKKEHEKKEEEMQHKMEKERK